MEIIVMATFTQIIAANEPVAPVMVPAVVPAMPEAVDTMLS